MDSKKIIFIALVLVASCHAHPQAPKVSTTDQVQEEKVGLARQALEGATNTLQNNLISSLTTLANSSAIAGANVSNAAALMIRGLVTNTFSLGNVVAYMPRLIFLDGPTQFIETLRLIRSNQIRLPTDMSSAIDTLLVFAGQVRDSGVGENFSPLVTYFPNIFAGVGDFLTTLIDSVFTFIAPVPAIPTVVAAVPTATP
ncbi:uncharacterized protein LOC110851576 [Folsomia candida]|uniref:Uncharacterized protein n=1 Tax=Folsomia candida TaxID=158441 RepID=A0A226E5Z3_FOLCA|nr:uncharacterized protein LOC110851576 [Folsomia candida]OXA52859.1 hypothetical protein Fcan01_12007 [Folsomia candida]